MLENGDLIFVKDSSDIGQAIQESLISCVSSPNFMGMVSKIGSSSAMNWEQ